MIIAIVYGERYGDKGIVCLDGACVEDKERVEVEKLFYSKIKHIKNISEDSEINVLNDRELLCQVAHSKKDDIGRIRMVQVLYDYFDDIDKMKKVASVVGFDYQTFCQINKKNLFKIRLGFFIYKIKKLIWFCLGFLKNKIKGDRLWKHV